MKVKVGSLFSGVGGLELGLECLGLDWELQWFAEPDPELVPAWADVDVPNLGEIRCATNWYEIAPVDLLLVGPPPQISMKSQSPWPQIQSTILATTPPLVFFEVPRNLASVQKGSIWAQITADLAGAGYRLWWLTLGACHVGIAHHRHRMFFLAVRTDEDEVPAGATRVPVPSCGALDVTSLAPKVKETATTRWAKERQLGKLTLLLPSPGPSDATKGGPNQRGSNGRPLLTGAVQEKHIADYAVALKHQADLYGAPPLPTEPNGRHAPRLSLPFTEWLMGFPKGHVSDVLPRKVGLKALGNATCPPQAGLAYSLLVEAAITNLGWDKG